MKYVAAGIAMVLWFAAASAAPLESQQREIDAGWWDWAAPLVVGGQEIPTRRGGVNVPEPRRDRRTGKAGGRAANQGPPFCSNGAGHPVHGWEWCVRKGFAGSRTVYDPRWERRRWEDIVFRAPRDRRRSGALDEVTLIDVLGSVVLGRFQEHRPHNGAAGPLTGRWVSGPKGARVLQLRSGHQPVAELSDLSGDGRVDLVLVYRGS